ncbi:hypothetical protein EDM59_21090 [Brevibacillus nitrificans]|uniref:Phosphatidic acid phosphatase type 2/haloperoxidase domain-containing protein n=1 Tax=Brevibacillus nitrificans TaxID=651560 RepID=A0A3M8D2L2_9BACL|nr:hypothetical protein EDM59_21090 [Brevibacillus nitrificans]
MLSLALLTGFSRIYVGHHYPGAVLGSIIVALIISVIRWLKGGALPRTSSQCYIVKAY